MMSITAAGASSTSATCEACCSRTCARPRWRGWPICATRNWHAWDCTASRSSPATPSTIHAHAGWPSPRSAQAHGGRSVHGLIWHSRQAELADQDPVEVMVLYGGPRFSSPRGSWRLFGPGASSLFDGPGRLLVDEIAESLSAVIELEA